MKIVCDKCATKYSIADEKVRGKVFKIRCKKCSHIIVVKGGADAEHGGADASSDAVAEQDDATVAGGMGSLDAGNGAGGDRAWYLVIGGEQVGPFSPNEVRGKFAAGEVDGETYGWKEGFADWLRLSAIEDFADLGSANGSVGRGLGDVFAAAPAPQDEVDGSDIFRPQPSSSGSGGADLFSASPSGGSAGHGAAGLGAEPDQKLTGQRNENSVLFSLSNLQALATTSAASKPAPAPVAMSTQVSAAPERAGFATAKNEGSGLIDIRAMAAATLSSVGPGSPSSGDSLDIPSFSAAPVFNPVVAAPVMMPTQQSGAPKWVWAVVGVGAVAVLGAFALMLALLLRKPEVVQQPVLATNAQPTTNAAAAPVPVAAPTVTPVPGANTAPAAVAAAAAPTAAAPAAREDKGAAHGGTHHEPKATHGAAAHAAATEKPAAPAPAPAAHAAAAAEDRPKPAKASRGGGGDDLDILLEGASPGGGKKSSAPSRAEAAPAEDENLPEQLDRGDVLAGMKSVTPKAMACYQQFHVPGVAMVAVVIGNKGSVTSANVSGGLAGTPTGDCVARAVKSARFKKFKGSPMSIQYPFQMR